MSADKSGTPVKFVHYPQAQQTFKPKLIAHDNHFENLSPTMRGSFKNPPPGKPLSEGASEEGEALGQKAGHLEEEDLARKNFRVVIITPEEVERLDLSDPDKSQRWIYTLSEESGGPGGADGSKSIREWDMIETFP